MKLLRNLSLGLALGALTVASGLLGSATPASAQGAPPGFFAVPGTSTALLITGQVGTSYIADFGNYGNPNQSGAAQIASDALIPFLIPTHGELAGAANNNGKWQSHFSNTGANFGFITLTPTAWGELNTVLIVGTGNTGLNNLFLNPSFPTANILVAFANLGPFSAGLNGSLFGDSDADAEHIEPFGYVAGNVGALQPGIRYTWKGPGGFSVAGAAELANSYGLCEPACGMWNNFWVSGTNNVGTAPVYTSSSLAGGMTLPDLILKARLDQPWGHISAAGIVHESSTSCSENCGSMPDVNKTGGGIYLSGHVNTWGKDSLKAGVVWGKGLGSMMGEWGGNDGLVIFPSAGGFSSYLGEEWGAHVGYTHFWTDSLRSSITLGYSEVTNNSSAALASFGPALANIFFDRSHFSAEGNLIWSPVPKVDLGIEYVYFQRKTYAFTALGWSGEGHDNRLSVESVFHF